MLRRCFASSTRHASPSFLRHLKTLESKGSSLGAHATMSNVESKDHGGAKACPFLTEHPLLSRTATNESNARSYNRRFPISVEKASGALVYDAEGNEYLDALAGAGTLNLGHNHPKLVEEAQKFLASGAPQQLLDLSNPAKDRFMTALLNVMPEQLKDKVRIQFTSPAGTDVVEAALKMAKRVTGRGNILCFSGAYHGHTQGSLALMGNLSSKEGIQNLMPGVHHLPYPYEYRCPFGIGKEGHVVIAEYIERLLNDVESGIVKPAAIIIEPIQGEGGVIPAPPEFLQRLRRITEEQGILLIVDEIQSGIGRSGKVFAFEHAGIAPDMICLSKGVGGGHPLGCVVYRTDTIDDSAWGPGKHAGTFRGSLLSMVCGARGLELLAEEKLPERAAALGDKAMKHLRSVAKEAPIVGDVRGTGLMLGVELVDCNAKPDHLGSFPPSGDLAADVQMRCFSRGLIIERGGRHGCVLRILCPIVTTDAQLDEMLEIFGESIIEASKAHTAK
jgi:diaminobutyrate-2-oxoglutarate transaminase